MPATTRAHRPCSKFCQTRIGCADALLFVLYFLIKESRHKAGSRKSHAVTLSGVHVEMMNHKYYCAIDCIVLDEINRFALTRGTTIKQLPAYPWR